MINRAAKFRARQRWLKSCHFIFQIDRELEEGIKKNRTIVNSDDDGGAPAAHVTHILGATDLHINEVLSSSVLAYVDEPKSGTMSQVTNR